MKKPNIIIGTVALLALGAGLWLGWQYHNQETTSSEVSTSLIDFSLPDLDGKPHKLSDWQGKLLVVNFWATWCPPCRKEIPAFIELQERYGARGVQFIGVALDNKAEVVEYRDAYFMNYPILLGTERTMALMADYGNRIGTLPYTVIINPHGQIVARKMGAYTQTELEQLFQPWIQEKTG